jgi:hypothetical protein
MLRAVDWKIVTDVSGQPIELIFKSQAVHEEFRERRNLSNRPLTYAVLVVIISRRKPEISHYFTLRSTQFYSPIHAILLSDPRYFTPQMTPS